MLTFFAMVLAYLIGSIPTGLWLGRYFLDIDVREHGSGNMGATNAFRVLGKKLGATVLFLDVLKGLAPVVILPVLMGFRHTTPLQELLIGGAAVSGHVFSAFVNFRGGKGVATALGVFLAIATWQMLLILVVGIAIILATGYVSAAAVVGALLLPPLLYLSGKSSLVLLVSCVIAMIVLVRHQSNIIRLFAGRESRLNDPVDIFEDDVPIPSASANRKPYQQAQ